MRNQVKTFLLSFNKDINIFKILSYLLILLGISLRISHYLMNRSFWLDEAMLSNNIINRSFAELLLPLDDRQIAPIGFLLAQKISITIFGANEFALRLLPLLCGVFSVLIFYLLLKRIVNDKVVVLGLVLFIFGKYLLHYSQEAKPYNFDVLCYIVFLYLFYRKEFAENSYLKLFGFGLLGGILIWFSHISIIILFSISLILFLKYLFEKDIENIKRLLIPTLIWALSIGFNYFFFLHNNSNETVQVDAFTSINYFPPTPFTLKNLSWFYDIIIHLIEFPLGIVPGIFLLIIMLIGFFNIIINKKYWIMLMGVPILLHFVLSLLKLYPFYGRFILYAIVYIIIIALMGFELLIQRRKLWGFILSGCFVLVFMARPIRYSLTPVYFEEIKPIFSYIERNQQQDDMVYIHYTTSHCFKFYENKFDLPDDVILGSLSNFNLARYNIELNNIKEKGKSQVWIVFSHITDEEKRPFIESSLTIGELVLCYEQPGASAYLIKIAK